MTDQGPHRLGEVLREAREAKGVDLVRVERDTKIRERYLSALERGEYRELPGAVYTKGFLRNYGAYLGLDPEDLIDLYRLETSTAAERPRVPVPPRPLAARRSRAFVVTPGAVIGAILTVLVGAFIAYLSFEVINFARTPDLRITDPPGNVSGYTGTSITIAGVTAPNARVQVDNLRENPTVLAGADGEFSVTVSLVPGSNVVRLTATDPVTRRDSATEERTILVVTDADATPTPDAATLVVEEPAADAVLTGPVVVAGQAQPGGTVTVTPTFAAPPPLTFRISDAAGGDVAVSPAEPSAPEATSLEVDAAGEFSGSITLPAGTWELAIATDGVDSVTRRVTVQPAEGLRGQIRIVGGESYLEVEEDGTPVAGVSGGIAGDGETIDLEATTEIRIRAGNAGAVMVTINGVPIGAMGDAGAVIEWRIQRQD